MNKPLKWTLIIGGSLGAVITAYILWNKQPKAELTINSDGSGIIKLGNKTATFSPITAVQLRKYGWLFQASKNSFILKKGSKTIQEGGITPYTSGQQGSVFIVNNYMPI